MDWNEIESFFVTIVLAITLFLLHVMKQLDEDLFVEGRPNIRIFALLLPATILGAGVGYILCHNFFQTPVMKEYASYQIFASICFGGFGAITIPALSFAMEMLVAFALEKLQQRLDSLRAKNAIVEDNKADKKEDKEKEK